jgi:hypothetical protein
MVRSEMPLPRTQKRVAQSMSNRSSSQRITIDSSALFGTGAHIGKIQDGHFNWLDDQSYTHIFTLTIPLEVVDSTTQEKTEASVLSQSTPPSLEFIAKSDWKVRGVTPDRYMSDLLYAGDKFSTGVDMLSRSVFLTDINSTGIDRLQTQFEIDAHHPDTHGQNFLGPQFDTDLNGEAATRASELLTTNVVRHEREHIRCLIDLRTALWRELELYCRSVLLAAKPQFWSHTDYPEQLAAQYMIPSRFTTELLAILREDYTTADSVVQQTVEQYVTAHRGAEGDLLRFISQQEIDTQTFEELVRTPIGETYCDLWLAYLVDKLRSGYSVDEIDAAPFRDRVAAERDVYYRIARDRDARNELIHLIHDVCVGGPVFEIVRLRFVDGTFHLERSWFSMDTETSDEERLLGVRQALYRRLFFSQFNTTSSLTDILVEREQAVARIIRGKSLANETLFDASYSIPDFTDHLEAARATAVETILGATASVQDLHTWLNEPGYGNFSP